MFTFYTDQTAFEAALAASGAQPTAVDFSAVPGKDYSTAAGYTSAGVTFVGQKRTGYQLSTAAKDFAGIANDYPTGSIQGPPPTDTFYDVADGSIAVTPAANTYAIGYNLFTVQSGNYAGDAADTVTLAATDASGASASGSGSTSPAASYSDATPSGFLGVISTAPIAGMRLTGTTTNDNIDIAKVEFAGAGSTAASIPTISGTHGTSTAAEMPVAPFAGVTLGDAGAGASDTVTIQLSGAAGTLSGAGLGGGDGGAYRLGPASPADLTSELDGLTFTPADPGPGNQATTTLTLTDRNGRGSVSDGGTAVTDTAAGGAAPPPPAPTNADALQVTSATIGADKRVVISGFASGSDGTASIALSGSVDGGPAMVLPADVTYGGAEDQNGPFTLVYDLGPNTLSSVSATLDDRDGGSVTTAVPDRFSGLPGRTGVTSYGGDGSQVTAQTHLRRDGAQTAVVEASGLTLQASPEEIIDNGRRPDNTFVFSPGFGLDVIHGFRFAGAGHDTIALPSADFADLAAVFRNTGDVDGSAFITDPVTGDAIRLAGVTTAELKAHPKDFALG